MIYTMKSCSNLSMNKVYFLKKEVMDDLIDCFKMNKYQSIDENIPYIGMKIYNMLDKPEHIDVLFEKYSKENNIDLSINLERLLYLAITFLYALEIIEADDKFVRRKE